MNHMSLGQTKMISYEQIASFDYNEQVGKGTVRGVRDSFRENGIRQIDPEITRSEASSTLATVVMLVSLIALVAIGAYAAKGLLVGTTMMTLASVAGSTAIGSAMIAGYYAHKANKQLDEKVTDEHVTKFQAFVRKQFIKDLSNEAKQEGESLVKSDNVRSLMTWFQVNQEELNAAIKGTPYYEYV